MLNVTLRRAVSAMLAACSVSGAAAAQPDPASPGGVPQPPPSCVPGRQLACGCSGGAVGTQVCAPNGVGYGACTECSRPSSAPRSPEITPNAGSDSLIAAETRGVDVDVAREALRDRWAERSLFAVYGAVGGSVDNPALAFSLGGRYRTGRSWLLGVDAEYNPWFAFHTRRFSRGTFNFYGTVVKRFVVNEELTLRTTGHLGTSVLLFDLVGAPAGSIGPYFGVNLLGLEYQLSPGLYLILDPADVALPVPHITGAPLTYLQYRLTLGVQFGA